MGVADSYLASFRQVGVVPGFDDVLSNAGVTALSAIPAANASFMHDLASRALAEGGANRRTQMTLDATADQNDLIRRENRRTGALRLAGTLLTSAMPGQTVAGVEVGNPLELMQALRDFNEAGRRDRASQMLRSNSAAAGLLKELG
jgi:hypothetical protein